MRIDILEEFLDLCTSLNFTKTAKAKHLSTSALSAHIASLEQEAGMPLFDRGRTIRLTEAGRLFVPYASKAVTAYRLGIEECAALRSEAVRDIVVAIPSLVHRNGDVSTAYVDAAARFSKESRKFRVRFATLPTDTTPAEALLNGTVDLALVALTMVDPHERLLATGVDTFAFMTEEVAIWLDESVPCLDNGKVTVNSIKSLRYPMQERKSSQAWREAVTESLPSIGIRDRVDLCSAYSREDYLFTCFAENDALFAPKTMITKDPLTPLVPNRVTRTFDPPLFTTAYIGYRDDAGNEVRELARYMEAYGHAGGADQADVANRANGADQTGSASEEGGPGHS